MSRLRDLTLRFIGVDDGGYGLAPESGHFRKLTQRCAGSVRHPDHVVPYFCTVGCLCQSKLALKPQLPSAEVGGAGIGETAQGRLCPQAAVHHDGFAGDE